MRPVRPGPHRIATGTGDAQQVNIGEHAVEFTALRLCRRQASRSGDALQRGTRFWQVLSAERYRGAGCRVEIVTRTAASSLWLRLRDVFGRSPVTDRNDAGATVKITRRITTTAALVAAGIAGTAGAAYAGDYTSSSAGHHGSDHHQHGGKHHDEWDRHHHHHHGGRGHHHHHNLNGYHHFDDQHVKHLPKHNG